MLDSVRQYGVCSKRVDTVTIVWYEFHGFITHSAKKCCRTFVRQWLSNNLWVWPLVLLIHVLCKRARADHSVFWRNVNCRNWYYYFFLNI